MNNRKNLLDKAEAEVKRVEEKVLDIPFINLYQFFEKPSLLSRENSDTKMCFELDRFHYYLFHKYRRLLKLKKPEFGFLLEDCYTPTGPEESYPAIETIFNAILTILKKLKETAPREMHQYLRLLNDFVKRIKMLPKPHDKSMIKTYEAAQTLLNEYQYKLDKPYLANTALLMVSMLLKSARAAYQPNCVTTKDLVRNNRKKNHLTLADIAGQICKETGVDSRSIQFVSLAVTQDNTIWATTNYHTPVIYPLECLLSHEKYKEAERYRAQFKVEHRQAGAHSLIFTPRIHAETMMAGLKDVLGIKQIFIVDGNGKKVENCPYCSHYLCSHGFSSQPHIEAIQNYEIPNEVQLQVVANWTLYLREKMGASDYSLVPDQQASVVVADEAVALSKQLLEQIFILLPYDRPLGKDAKLNQIFAVIKETYPFSLDEQKGLKDTYHVSWKLAHPEAEKVSRTIVRKTIKSTPHPSFRLKIFDDKRLNISKKRPRLDAAPDSPRSEAIANYVNEWLKDSDDIAINQKDGLIKLSRG